MDLATFISVEMANEQSIVANKSLNTLVHKVVGETATNQLPTFLSLIQIHPQLSYQDPAFPA